MALAHVLGFPRIGAQRELKFAQESFWQGTTDETALRETGASLRARHWRSQADAGLDFVTVGDFAWYDQVLGTLALLGAIPKRFGFDPKQLKLAEYFTLARGDKQHFAMEMTKWFDTNYHYLVPEWSADSQFDGGVNWLFDEIAEAQALGYRVKVALVGPLTLLHVGKVKSDRKVDAERDNKLDLLPSVLAGYKKLLSRLQVSGVEVVQIDEPILALELDSTWIQAFSPAYAALEPDAPPLLLTTYFGEVQEHAALLRELPVMGVHLDLVRGAGQLDAITHDWPDGKVLSLGVVDGRNLWRCDLDSVLTTLKPLQAQLGDRLWIGSSCSLLHVPVDLKCEDKLDVELKSWLSFATQKLSEIVALKLALNTDKLSNCTREVDAQFVASRTALASRRHSTRIHNPLVQKRLAALTEGDAHRTSAFKTRIDKQQEKWKLPLFPTTTIGSFPQTQEIRKSRAAYKRGDIGHLDYLDQMRDEIRLVVQKQEELGLDVLVHGEPERNDMVEYFGEQLWGYAFTANGWVQSYGSRCVKPPVIYGDVYRPEAMTVGWSQFAQTLTDKPMKGMLTGPVTMLQWSFVRDDQPRETTALQIALALRDEVHDLEKSGIGMIQIDEPAFREGLPLKATEWKHYLDWAVRAFKISAAGVSDETQIHTHMCYSEFNDILPWIAAMDADVITIETSRSDMELLDGFGEFSYPNDIGPGVYDIHSPRVAQVYEMERLLRKARGVIPDQRLWVNPDCGLKTRGWPETYAALENMVTAARRLRAEVEAERKAA
ncbi:5-methyltetrahydropteroyltriglutamate--homocysteine S-methyltransferase [Glaciimonas sp. Gout2]|uniref:5-methyltetrahydropteroyltriglutamate-- homocysteine S-methyltransferase n=1 Tax=unclassified Glaciimonas TaxID=2644401 RepID=UPI002B226CB0|nr:MULTISPECIES: 5-methyltetrahydropteroyltriglutamate--homocysteine S-methyltransferase [unclassified Glaciimonas]MEB0014321.1 5-methyltetrahydropteroyltriglutamate--homocysteine S-methyltransferase [Glaciimonas sp. Cout2]MEB0084108.1 5-methyltetrahydropteroyltriglutamate--homocysteine S-methyltransferase [Glaciimonas sp. Gout2]